MDNKPIERPYATPNCCEKPAKWVQQSVNLAYFYCETCKKEVSDVNPYGGNENWWTLDKVAMAKYIKRAQGHFPEHPTPFSGNPFLAVLPKGTNKGSYTPIPIIYPKIHSAPVPAVDSTDTGDQTTFGFDT